MAVLINFQQYGEFGLAKEHVGSADEFATPGCKVVADEVLVELVVRET